MAAESGARKRGPKAELLRRRLNDLRVEAEAARGREGTQARLGREVRGTREPGTERFQGKRASDWAPAETGKGKPPRDLGPLLAMVAVWSAWKGEASLRADGTIDPRWRRTNQPQWDRLLREAHEEPEEPVTPAAAEQRAHIGLYLEQVRNRHRRLNLDVLGPSGMAGEQPMIEVRQVFMPQWAKPYVPRMREELRQALQGRGELVDEVEAGAVGPPAREERARPVLASLAEEGGRRAVVLGDPGAGKSTLAKYLALALAGGLEAVPEELAPLEGLVPVLVELREYAVPEARADTIEDFIERAHEQAYLPLPRELLTGLLREGGAVVLFDGLDEVFDPATRAAMARRVTAFAAKYPKCRVVVTSREYGYQSHEFASADFCQLMLEDLTREQVEEFVRRWYRAAYPDDPQLAERRIDRMLGAVRDVGSVGELAGNPLLLTILAAIGQSRTIPRERREMYAHAIEVLIERWDRDAKLLAPPTPRTTDVAHALEGLTVSRRLKLLERVARRMQEGVGSPAGTFIHHDDLIDIVRDFLVESNVGASVAMAAAKELVDHLRTRNFLLAHYGGGLYGFVHRTFMEYLAALDLLRRREEEEWEREELAALLAERAEESAWHEVLLLMAGKLRQKDVAALLGRLTGLYWEAGEQAGAMLGLALRVLAEVEEVGPSPGERGRAELSVGAKSDAIVDALIYHTTTDRNSLLSIRPALRTFDHFWSGRERYLRWYRGCVAAGNPPAFAHGVVGALTRDLDEALRLLDDPWTDGSGVALVEELVRWSGQEKALDYVLRVARGEGLAGPRDAFSLLSLLWPDQKQAFSAVVAGMASDRPQDVRVGAVHALRGWNTRRAVDQLWIAFRDADPAVRANALPGLVHDWMTGPEVVEAGLADEAPEVRRSALSGLGSMPDRKAARRFLLLGLSDPEPSVCAYAHREAVMYWRADDEMRRVLMDSLVHPMVERREWATRWVGWMTAGEEAEALRGALRDPAPEVRVTALAAMKGTGWSEEEYQKHLERAAHDEDPSVRLGALRSRSEIFGQPQLPAWLQAARSDESAQLRAAAVSKLAQHSAEEEAFSMLVLASQDESPEVRTESLRGLREASTRPDSARHAIHSTLSDPDPTVRAAALEALTLRWPTHPETHAATLAALTDPDSTVRADAITALAVRHPDQAHPLALRAAREDESPSTRSRYLRLVTLLWPDAPTTPTLLTDRAQQDDSDQVRTTATEGLARLRWLATEIA
ncbi:HEAT repeat domain-containing protein [Streptomyces albidoflavus]